jgi:predicted flap endonuclease-1-like 5' DNA nuclease
MRHIVASFVLMAILPACAAHVPTAMAPAASMPAAMTEVDAQATRRTYKIEDLEGIGPAYAAKLQAQGIFNTKQLLEKLATRKDRTAIAQATGISDKRLLSFANKADLMRIPGIGPQMSDLLEAIGINTVPQLAQRADHEALRERMRFANEISKAFVKQLPNNDTVRGWIVMAGKMDRMIQY